jgi:hypothetical protein
MLQAKKEMALPFPDTLLLQTKEETRMRKQWMQNGKKRSC